MIAVDVMGGDHAPTVVLQGAVAAAKKAVPVMLCGPQAFIHHWLSTNEPEWYQYPISVADAPDIIAMDDEPAFAVRKKPQSSLVKAVASVAQGQSKAVLSAGNSGALMAASAFIIGRQEGVERPAIAGLLPTDKGKTLALDLGANTECRPYHLHQFAHLGSEYVRSTQHIAQPTIGLLSNGQEEGKGSALTKETFPLLRNDGRLNFIGNVEPYDIFMGKADVVVCDGFSGNVLLKTMEAVCHVIASWAPSTLKSTIDQRLGNKTWGGALLLGVKGCVVVCHGNSDGSTIEQAILLAHNVSDRKVL